MDCSPPGSSVYGTSQATILEWVAISSSRGSSQPRGQTHVPCIAGGFFTTEPPGPIGLIVEGIWSTGTGLIGLHMKGRLTEEKFTNSRNDLEASLVAQW